MCSLINKSDRLFSVVLVEIPPWKSLRLSSSGEVYISSSRLVTRCLQLPTHLFLFSLIFFHAFLLHIFLFCIHLPSLFPLSTEKNIKRDVTNKSMVTIYKLSVRPMHLKQNQTQTFQSCLRNLIWTYNSKTEICHVKKMFFKNCFSLEVSER